MTLRPSWVYAGRFIHIVDAVDGGCTLAVVTKLIDEEPELVHKQDAEEYEITEESTLMYYTAFPWHGGSTDTVHRGTGRLADSNWHPAEACESEVSKAMLK